MPDKWPKFLYHAAPKAAALSIVTSGLEPRSGTDPKYLSMSGTESGARTLNNRADDIIFRAATSTLDSSKWTKSGAGKEEWRGTETIPGDDLEWRRNLGTPAQRTWGRNMDLITK